jgi:uncharacterized protein YbcI
VPEVPQPPEPELESKDGEPLLSALSREMVMTMKKYYGRGPTQAKSYLVDDLLFVVMRGGTTEGERTLLDAGMTDTVREFRQKFENLMAERLVGTVEQLTDRKVLTYQSQILFDPEVIVEMFVFDRPLERSALQETADALLAGDDASAGAGLDPGIDRGNPGRTRILHLSSPSNRTVTAADRSSWDARFGSGTCSA